MISVLLLVSAVGGVVAAVVIGSTIALTAAGAYAVVAGIAAAVLLESVVAQVRRLWAYDRANLAGAYRTAAVARSAEQVEFAESMAARVAEKQAQITRLEAEITRAERRREELGQALADEQERSAELEASLEQVQEDLAHLRDALTASEAAEKRARAEVVAWEAESRTAGLRDPADGEGRLTRGPHAPSWRRSRRPPPPPTRCARGRYPHPGAPPSSALPARHLRPARFTGAPIRGTSNLPFPRFGDRR